MYTYVCILYGYEEERMLERILACLVSSYRHVDPATARTHTYARDGHTARLVVIGKERLHIAIAMNMDVCV